VPRTDRRSDAATRCVTRTAKTGTGTGPLWIRRHVEISHGGEEEMSNRSRFGALLATLAFVATACTGGATSAPASGAGGLTGSLTVWHSYGSGAGTEAAALKTVTDKIKAANSGLKLTIQDVKFDDLFKKFELEAASGGGPDLFIAPNDSLGKEARAKLFLDVTSMLEGKLGNASAISVAGSKVDGKLYMVPESLKAVAMYYNKSKVATPPATTADLLQAIKDGKVHAGFDAHSA
jgi:maltose-binding protein MalE